ncbi:MAG: hypothetical protein ACLFSE_05480 [Spirochaetia bacterium]
MFRKKAVLSLFCGLLSVMFSGCGYVPNPPLVFSKASLIETDQAFISYTIRNRDSRTITGFSGSFYLYPGKEEHVPDLHLSRKFSYSGSIPPESEFTGIIPLEYTGEILSETTVDQFRISRICFGEDTWDDIFGLCIYPGMITLREPVHE